MTSPLRYAPLCRSPPATPIERIYGFCHVQDRFTQVQSAWNAIGLGAFGPVQDVASVPSPDNDPHMLSTSVEPAQPNQYHTSPTTDPTAPAGAPATPSAPSDDVTPEPTESESPSS